MEMIKRQVVEEQSGIFTLHIDRIDGSLPRNFIIYEILSAQFGFKGDVVDLLCHALDNEATGKRFYSRDWVAVVDRQKIVVATVAEDDDCETLVDRTMIRSYAGGSVLFYEYCDIDFIETLDMGDNVALLDADKLQFPP